MSRKEKTHEELFEEFVSESRERLAKYVCNLPDSEYDGIRSGRIEVAFAVQETDRILSLTELRDGLQEIARNDQRANMLDEALHRRTKPIQHAIESVCPTDAGEAARGYDSDYLRFRTDGYLFYAGQYHYYFGSNEPSLIFDFPIYSIGRALIFALAACKLWEKAPSFLFSSRFLGLAGRRLSNRNGSVFHRLQGAVCYSPEVKLRTLTLSTDQVNNCFVDTLHNILIPLYEHFNYLQLSRNSVAQVFAPDEDTAN